MRKLLIAVPALFALWAAPAQAQFGNTSLGLSAGYLQMFTERGVFAGFPITLEGSRYMENGFETYARIGMMILTVPTPVPHQVIGATPTVGIRYLFSEENIRPYIGADIAYLHIFEENSSYQRVGPGLNAGIDMFLNDSFTIGARGTAAMLIVLNRAPDFSFGALAVASTYF